MPSYFFIQSLDPLVDRVTDQQFALISQLVNDGKAVSVLLIQAGVAPALVHAACPAFEQLLATGVTIYADRFSLQQRDIAENELKNNIKAAELNIVVQAMLDGEKVIWN